MDTHFIYTTTYTFFLEKSTFLFFLFFFLYYASRKIKIIHYFCPICCLIKRKELKRHLTRYSKKIRKKHFCWLLSVFPFFNLFPYFNQKSVFKDFYNNSTILFFSYKCWFYFLLWPCYLFSTQKINKNMKDWKRTFDWQLIV